MSALPAANPTIEEQLRAHLLTHLEQAYADGFMESFAELCSEIVARRRPSGAPQRTRYDGEIHLLWRKIEANHVYGERLPDYWETFWRYTDLLCRRDIVLRYGEEIGGGRKMGRPRDEESACLIEWLNDHYPPEIARTSRGKDFEKTLSLMRAVVGLRETSDLTRQVFDVLSGNKPPTLLSAQIKEAWRTK